MELDLGRVRLRGYEADLAGAVLCMPSPTPHAERAAIRERHLEWAERIDLCPAATVERLKFWNLWTDCAPTLEPAVASIVSDYCLMFTVLDDAAERYLTGSSQDVANAALGDFVAVLDGRTPAGGAAVEYPKYTSLLAALADLRARILRQGLASHYPVFVAGMERYRRGVSQQIYMSHHHVPMSRETQLYNRSLNVAFDPTVTLLCMLRGIPFAAELVEHPMMGRLHIAICRLGAVINDIISFPKEVAHSEANSQYHNLVSAHFNEHLRLPGIADPLGLAIARTFEFHNNELRDILEIGAHVVETRPELRDYVDLGLDMHRSWMNWCLSAERYGAAIASRRVVLGERTVRLAPGDDVEGRPRSRSRRSVRPSVLR